MTSSEKNKLHAIIHSHAAACGAGNLVPIPGLGISADLAVFVSMAMSIAVVLGGEITTAAARAVAIAEIKKQAMKHPVKYAAKEVSKFIPFLGPLVAPAISVAMAEAAGWGIAQEIEAKRRLSR